MCQREGCTIHFNEGTRARGRGRSEYHSPFMDIYLRDHRYCQAGGKVVFCDTDRVTFNIDTSLIESKVNQDKGIIPVHLYGQPANMDPILEIGKGQPSIEDCSGDTCHLQGKLFCSA